jgi:hypothetical protein
MLGLPALNKSRMQTGLAGRGGESWIMLSVESINKTKSTLEGEGLLWGC